MVPNSSPLTLMAVHAHPDDEASGTGGVLARYAAEGVRTVLVTCTGGELGDAPGGVKPGEPGHDPSAVVSVRAAELEESCRILGVTHLERLGYHDSGMMGWEQNEAPDNFWNTPVDVAASRLGDLMEAYRPQVVVTYDANGFYGHPDHIQAHRITMAAAEATGIPDKVYFTAIPKSALPEFEAMMAEAGVDMPEETTATEGEREGPEFGTDDELIAAVVDCAPFVDAKYDALAAHASQTEDIFFLRLGRELFDRFFGQEAFVRAVDRTGAPVPEADLFAGLR